MWWRECSKEADNLETRAREERVPVKWRQVKNRKQNGHLFPDASREDVYYQCYTV